MLIVLRENQLCKTSTRHRKNSKQSAIVAIDSCFALFGARQYGATTSKSTDLLRCFPFSEMQVFCLSNSASDLFSDEIKFIYWFKSVRLFCFKPVFQQNRNKKEVNLSPVYKSANLEGLLKESANLQAEFNYEIKSWFVFVLIANCKFFSFRSNYYFKTLGLMRFVVVICVV